MAGHPSLGAIAEPLLAVRGVLRRELAGLERRVRARARSDLRARLLMTAPGVGAVISLTYASAIDDPARFKSSKIVGAFFGMTPTRYQSGETDVSGRISRIGDAGVRAILYEGAHVILTKPVKGCTAPKSRAKRIEESAAVSRTIRGLRPVGDGLWLGDGAVKSRAGMKKAKVALARKLAVIMHRMLADGTPFIDAAKAAA